MARRRHQARFADDAPVPSPPFTHDPRVEADRARFLADWRASRDAATYETALARITTTARGTGNLMPPILAALQAKATLGEVCDAMRAVFGVYRPGEKL